jgi:hypothetical protein
MKEETSSLSNTMKELIAMDTNGRRVTRTGQNMSSQLASAMTMDEDERIYQEAKKQMEHVSKELEEHLQDRSFTRRQVEALIHFNPIANTSPIKQQHHYKMKPKGTYAPSTYGRGRRKLKETPTATFKNFLHAKPPQASVLSPSTQVSKVKTPSSKLNKEALTSMWSTGSNSYNNSNNNSTSSKLPVKARF